MLAYIGDAAFELMVRERMVFEHNIPVNRLHKKSVAQVCAKAQSDAMKKIADMLSEEETDYYKRGRNANGNHVPKNAVPREYRRATGFECLFGFLHLTGQTERMKELFAVIWTD